MFIKEINSRVNKKGYEGKITLLKLQNIDIKTQEGRFNLLVAILELSGTFGIILREGNEMYSESKINTYISKCLTYHTTKRIVGFNLSRIAELLVFEFKKQNNNVFDYNEFEKYYKGKTSFEFFILDGGNENKYSYVWEFFGKNGKSYTGEGFLSLSRLKGNDVLDILENYKGGDEDIEKTIKYLFDNKNLKIIKEKFRSVRAAGLQLLKGIVNSDVDKTEIFKMAS